MHELAKRTVDQWMREHSARFSVNRMGKRQVSEDPFDPIPCILSGAEFTRLELGLIQRINALNQFFFDVYHDRMILRDGVIPEEFVYSSPDFRPEIMGIAPIQRIYSHITATDLLRTAEGTWYVLDDTLSDPEGISLPHLARKLLRDLSPEDYDVPGLCDNCGLDILLRQLYRDILDQNPRLADGAVVLLLEGNENDFEVEYLAALTGAVAARAERLIVMDNKVYYRASAGGFQRVSVLHRLCPDWQLDPLCFDTDSPCGIPHLMEVYGAGNIAILNAPGCAVGEDRGLYYFVPDMIRYYLDEEPLLPNIPTYLPWYPEQRDYILTHMDRLFFKDASSRHRVAAIRGSALDEKQRADLAKAIAAQPRRYIAQEILAAGQLPVVTEQGERNARCDLRLFTFHSDSIRVWMGGMARFALRQPEGARIGFKDVWVMAE